MYGVETDDELDEVYFVLYEFCECCGRPTATRCPICGAVVCQDCLSPFGAHTCEPDMAQEDCWT